MGIMKYTNNKKTSKKKIIRKKTKNKKGGKPFFSDEKMIVSEILSDTNQKIKKKNNNELIKYKFVTVEKYNFGEKIIYDSSVNNIRRLIFYIDNQSVFVSDICSLNNFIKIEYINDFAKNINKKKREIIITFQNDQGNKVR